MPNIKSAIKRMKTNEKSRLRNASQKSALRSVVKSFDQAVQANDADKAQTALLKANKTLDKAASKGLIHKNAAARKKSRLTKQYNALAAK